LILIEPGEFRLAFPGGFGFFLPFYAGLFIMFVFSGLSENPRLLAGALEAPEGTVQSFAFTYPNFCHCSSLPSAVPQSLATSNYKTTSNDNIAH
jgi:hypothetical protein